MQTCTTKSPKQDQALLDLWERLISHEDSISEPPSDSLPYWQELVRKYTMTARACVMAAYIYKRAKLRDHSAMCRKMATLADNRRKMSAQYSRQIVSYLSFGDAAVFHQDWHGERIYKLSMNRDELLSSQQMLEAELFAMLQVNAWEGLYDEE